MASSTKVSRAHNWGNLLHKRDNLLLHRVQSSTFRPLCARVRTGRLCAEKANHRSCRSCWRRIDFFVPVRIMLSVTEREWRALDVSTRVFFFFFGGFLFVVLSTGNFCFSLVGKARQGFCRQEEELSAKRVVVQEE